MKDLVVGFALALVLEGLLWALLPHMGRRLMAASAETPEPTLRMLGALAVATGVGLVWLVRG